MAAKEAGVSVLLCETLNDVEKDDDKEEYVYWKIKLLMLSKTYTERRKEQIWTR